MNPESRIPDKPADESVSPPSPKRRLVSWLPVIVLFVVFLLGFVPMWLKAGRLEAQVHRAQRELRLAQIRLTLANAALDARRGDYEPARQGAADFFSQITAELDRGSGSVLPVNARTELQPILAGRDDLITLLARGDPASAERLANAQASFEKMLGPPTP
jgi:hypothetical protein